MNKFLTLAVIGVLAASVVGLSIDKAKAFSDNQRPNFMKDFGNGKEFPRGRQPGIEAKAELFGLSADELKEQLKTKTIVEIAREKNITYEQMQEFMRVWMTKRWQENGLTQEDIESRIQGMTQRQINHKEWCDFAQ
ncbi:hypothetical protein A3K34_01790 [candidate division WWE3 bacterium RIFOXYC1_FULL_40_10]|uniref:Uncharacterized protein n=1 Tax=candidate division WWE3 bacterium RIFOXYA2_FULL_46_9 TaxID=1802636 RepID=A0A1F4W2K3_UNCKA|nr:MAG: hypothetical protein A3K58_01790 [candidate division WWE3 bacterium RIFOXYB1_FULL_40_22]OGC61595.1 MAG: hypothetical protein A3K37_01790 [candidate division WWE3 bacterium RIFOXYA1_FULL_40_11]OGC63642.1 MAG: hypothetical protein A2264_04735 [candidate division WWE3 bacterium RIFOXYA2_FULL_46_9]OGC64727.1 MAG: hypothetical protein A2326_01660 [candidate division WWE3 bacterium RIFOXYB2_FULL_41_6]OGC65978.1 MAG: hypothetical protein A3K34_01790 [candidate division WWE3 bacterium RIFOXYC1_